MYYLKFMFLPKKVYKLDYICFFMKKIILLLLVISLTLSLYVTSVKSVVFDESFYEKEFEKNNVYENVEDADEINRGLLLFLKGEDKLPNVFTKKEMMHMVDVRDLINLLDFVFILLCLINIVLLCFLLFYSKDLVRKLFIFSGFFGIVLPIPLFFLKFSNLFLKFHLIFFPQGNWSFDYSTMLIKLYSNQFFYDSLVKIGLNSFIFCLLFLLIGFSCQKKVVTKLYSLLHKSL